jgi:hypothetical protein
VRTPSAETLLQVWERGVDAGPRERGTLLLRAAHAGIESPSWHTASLGTRNAALLDLRVRLFGSDLDGVAECPACNETIEIGLPLARLEWPAPAAAVSVTAAGYDVEARLPTIADIGDLGDVPGQVDAAALALLERCVVSARRAGEAVAAASLPPAVVDAVSTAMASADPHGVIELVVACPACDERSAVVLDPAGYLWSELHRWAIRTLHEIHALATAYGWSEADILALSPTRRQAYLQLVAA